MFDHSNMARRALKNIALGMKLFERKHTFICLVGNTSLIFFNVSYSISCVPGGSRDYRPHAA